MCAQCLRPTAACLCACVQTVSSQVELLILQHPDEQGHAKNTARLLHLCVPGSRLEVGESFAPAQLAAWLHAPTADGLRARSVLLYPPPPDDPCVPVQTAPPLPPAWSAHPEQLRVVVLDGTWRKSRKMLYRNPALQQLPRLALDSVPARRYAIRKAHRSDQLSTFEATACALAQLHDWDEHHPAAVQLLRSFEAAMALHQRLQREHQPSAFENGAAT